LLELVTRYRGDDFRLTVDGNEQFKTSEDFARLEHLLADTPELEPLRRNLLAIEQPLGRAVALDAELADDVRRLGQVAPVIIDESDGTLTAYDEAIQCGYLGVSSKNCKGPVKSLLNAGLTWLANDRGKKSDYIMTGEDLCSVGVLPVQADLCLAATLGLDHVERNGHHYHRGLGYLPEANQRAALAAHGDFYKESNGVVAPRLSEGRFNIASLQCEGFGFAALPDMNATASAAEWQAGKRP
jgi:hypothetical protein